MRGLTRLRGRSPFGAAKARASITLSQEAYSVLMDCRVKPGNDDG
jgi:error-prone DNA polymerase